MHKKDYVLGVLIIILVASCGSQSSITPSQTLAPIQTFTIAPVLTQSPSSVIPSTATQALSSVLDRNILQNELIAYTRGQSINIIPAIGGISFTVIQDFTVVYFFSPSWSPNGKQIVFSSEGRDVAPRINLINRDGTGLKELRRGIGSVSEPAWSPDGETIVYSTSQGLFLTSANGPELHQINVPGSPNWLIFPSWSPDGKKLALIGSNSDNFYGPYNIYLVNRDGGGLNAINDIVAGVGHLTWSPDGKKIAFRSYQDCGDINILDLDTGNITNLTNSVGVAELDPAWSADGNYIAYSKGFYERCAQDQVYYDQGENIYVIQIDGENETQLTTTGGNHPVWWPKVILRSNWKYSVTKAGSGLNVREVATTSAKSLIKLKPGEVFTALEGSIDAEGYHWQRVRTESGIEGWCVDVPGWYMFDSAD